MKSAFAVLRLCRSALLKSFCGATLLAIIATPALAVNFTVINTSDSGPGSLRQAILNANANGSGEIDQILIDIPTGGPLVPIIAASTPLPPITSPCEIGSAALTGIAAHVKVPSHEHGLRVESDRVFIRHLSIEGAGAGRANIIFSGVTGGGVIDCRINDSSTLATSGIASEDGIRLARGGILGANFCREVDIRRCTIMGADRAGVWSDSIGATFDLNDNGTGDVRECVIRQCGRGIVFNSASDNGGLVYRGSFVRLEGNVIDSCAGNAIELHSTVARVRGNRIGLAEVSQINAGATTNGGYGVVITGTWHDQFWRWWQASYENGVFVISSGLHNNVISGNRGGGVLIDLDGLEASLALTGNHIGVDLAGTTARPNGTATDLRSGVLVMRCPGDLSDPDRQLIIGGNRPEPAYFGQLIPPNIISGNTGSGVALISGEVRGVHIRQNRIGTNLAGTLPVSNGLHGVVVSGGTQDVLVGLQAAPGFTQPRCLIGGNLRAGIFIGGVGEPGEITASNVRVVNCAIGTTDDGVQDLGNATVGVILSGHIRQVTVAASVVAASGEAGVRISTTTGHALDSSNVALLSNFIGVNAAEAGFLFANPVGVEISAGDQILLHRNVLAGNTLHGVRATGGTFSLLENTIGGATAQKRNGSHGVVLGGTSRATATGNVLGGNQGDGIVARDTAYASFRRNLAFGNSGLGLNLQPAGEANSTPTPNDPGDADGISFPNAGMNQPVITAATESGNNWIISGTLDSLQSAVFPVTIELFGSTLTGYSGRPHADAEHYLGSVQATGPSWSLTVPKRTGVVYLAATATLTEATSELSAPFVAPSDYVLEIIGMEYVPPLPGGPPTAFGYYINYTCRPGKTYKLERSTTMQSGSWTSAGTRTPGFPGFDRFFVNYEGGRLFWRVQELP